jgi:hypothetical protein
MNEIECVHPSPQSSPLRGGEAKSKHARHDRTASEWKGSPLLFARGEGEGEEIHEQDGQFPGNQQSDLRRGLHRVIAKNVRG